MKKYLLSIIGVLAFALTPSLALDPHDAQYVAVTNPVTITATTATTIATLTTHAVNSGTNSYFITAVVHYKESSYVDGAAKLQLSVGGSPITTTVIPVAGANKVVLIAEQESIAASTAITVQGFVTSAVQGNSLIVTNCQLTIMGLAGNTQ